MAPTDSKTFVKAFGGVSPLRGRKLVRLVYLDEGGTSKHEPFVVVGGVIIDADKKLIPVEDHLEFLVTKHIPEEDREGFVFHATNIWSGTGYFSDKAKWPFSKRISILGDLVEIPSVFHLPIAYGHVERAKFPPEKPSKEPTQKELDASMHAVALVACAVMIESAMRESIPDEIALLIAEDRDKVRNEIKETHALIRNQKALERHGIKVDCLPIQRIRDTVHFAKKKECRHLQLADLCTFFIRGHLSRHPKIGPFYERLKPMMLAYTSAVQAADKAVAA